MKLHKNKPPHRALTANACRNGPSHEEIAVRAYAIYEGAGCAPGHDLDNWIQAETELLRQRPPSIGAPNLAPA